MLNEEQITRLSKSQTSITKYLNIEKLLDIKKMIRLEYAKFMYNYMHKSLPKRLLNLFEKSSHTYDTRNQNVPIIPFHQSSIYNHSYMVKSTVEWLKVPVDLRPNHP